MNIKELKKIIIEELHDVLSEENKVLRSDTAHLNNIKNALERDGIEVEKQSGEAVNEFDKFMFDVLDVIEAMKTSKKYNFKKEQLAVLDSYPGSLKSLRQKIGVISDILRKQGQLNVVFQTADPNIKFNIKR